MSDVKFVIRCPHCRLWSKYYTEPSELIVKGVELPDVLGAIEHDRPHPKRLTCEHVQKGCVAPFDAFVCRDENEAKSTIRHYVIKALPDRWSHTLQFRLRMSPEGHDRWHERAVLCFNQRVRREPDICLTRLLDRSLLSKIIAAFQIELGGPATVFEGWAPRDDPKAALWRPIEAFTLRPGAVPPKYNSFCELCRRATTEELQRVQLSLLERCDRREGRSPKCGETTCLEEKPDWSRCPEYLDQRRKLCPCYRSDVDAIQQACKRWKNGDPGDGDPGPEAESPVGPYYLSRCWANFAEVAVPLVVLNSVLAVAMWGQMLLPGERLLPRDDLLARHPGLPRHLAELDSCLDGLRRAQKSVERGKAADPAWQWTLVSADEFKRRARIFAADTTHLAAVTGPRYEQTRVTSEQLFRRYLFGRLDANSTRDPHVKDVMPLLLSEMTRFWAIRDAFFLGGLAAEERLELVARSTDGRSAPLGDDPPGVAIEVSPLSRRVYVQDGKFRDDEDKRLWEVAQTLTGRRDLTWVLAVFVPLSIRRALFLFVDRNVSDKGSLPCSAIGHISEFTRSTIMDTCQMVTERLRDMWHVDDILENAIVTGHEIKNAIGMIRQPLGRLNRLADSATSAPEAGLRAAACALAHHSKRVCRAAHAGLDAAALTLDRLTIHIGLTEALATLKPDAVDIVQAVRGYKDLFVTLWRGPESSDLSVDKSKRWKDDFANAESSLVAANEKFLDIVVQNLLDNAFKHSDSGRTVSIVGSSPRAPGEFVLTISNYGPVIEATESTMVLERGYRGVHARRRKATAAEGTGLGLYLVDRIVGAFKGRFEISSDAETRVTTAVLRLPLWEKHDETPRGR